MRPAEHETRQGEAQPDSRMVRVFISSTFRDMQAERDELAKRIFPALRNLCESRGVAWGEVDLRWGITDEQRAEGQVLPICLTEIEGCRPYFIGLLGERYGWVPDAIEPAVLERQPWLAELAGHSVTEFEILHGVLRDRSLADHAFFYLRDPGYLEGKPAQQYQEVPTPEEIAEHGPEEAEHRAADRRVKLAALKDRIRSSGLPVREGYKNPMALGELVLADLTEVIERLYPAGSQPDPLAREAAEHESFAASRAGVHIGRREYFDALDAAASGDAPPLVIVGDSGAGKSALLANWALGYRAAHPEQPLLMHFIGASAQSSDWAATVRRIIGELSIQMGMQIDIPDEPAALRQAFAKALEVVGEKGRVILVIDALDQLDDREGALDLAWLPKQIPANVRMVLSSLSSRPHTETQRRLWPSLRIEPLESGERRALISDYLAGYSRQLGEERATRIAAAQQSANPLYLRALLDELRLWGEHETLDDAIAHYLSAGTVDSLYELILARCEADYERDRPGLVRDAFSLMWAARRGLSETELLDLLGSSGQPLPRAFWSPLYLAAHAFLANRSGLLSFFHDYLRQAVEHRYLSTQEARDAAHLRLADYFGARAVGSRQIEELPWHLAQAGAWQRLTGLLADLRFLEAAWSADESELKAFWAQVEGNSSFRMVDAFRPILGDPAQSTAGQRLVVAALLRDTGHFDETLALYTYSVAHCRAAGDRAELGRSLRRLADLLALREDTDGAMALLKEMEQVCRESGDPSGLASALGGQAGILSGRRDFDGAWALLEDEERVCRESHDPGGLASALGSRADILRGRKDFDGAMVLLKEQEGIYRESGDLTDLGASLRRQALILFDRGDYEGSLALQSEAVTCRQAGDRRGLQGAFYVEAVIPLKVGAYEEAFGKFLQQERICRQTGDRLGLASALGGLAMTHVFLMNRAGRLRAYEGVMALLKEQEGIYRELGLRGGLASSFAFQANVLHEQRDLEGAMALRKQEEDIYRELGQSEGVANSLGNQALILKDLGDVDGAMALLRDEELICREIGHSDGLRASLDRQAEWLQRAGDLDGAMAIRKEQERTFRELGQAADVAEALGYQADLLQEREDLDGAMALRKQEEQIWREIDASGGLQRSIDKQAVILAARAPLDTPGSLQASLRREALYYRSVGDLERAMELLQKQEQIARRIGDRHGLQMALSEQGLVLRSQGNLNDAMERFTEQECVCSEIGDQDGLQRSFGNQAAILHARGDLHVAMGLYRAQEQICREHNFRDGLHISLGNQARIREVRRDFDGALAQSKEKEQICREIGDLTGLQDSLGDQVRIHQARGDLDQTASLQALLQNEAVFLQAHGDLDGALALYNECERVCRAAGDRAGLQMALGDAGLILQGRGDLGSAMGRYMEQEAICREIGDMPGLQCALGNRATILWSHRDPDSAMKLYQEQERICREIGSTAGLHVSIGNQALVLEARGDLDGAMSRLQEKESICREIGDTAGLQRSLEDQARIGKAREQ